jgi:hypothetical protein
VTEACNIIGCSLSPDYSFLIYTVMMVLKNGEYSGLFYLLLNCLTFVVEYYETICVDLRVDKNTANKSKRYVLYTGNEYQHSGV